MLSPSKVETHGIKSPPITSRPPTPPSQNITTKVYVVFWSDTFDDWRMEKVFSCEDKARSYIKEKKGNRWHEEMAVL
jgi:hypothetical protein